MPFNVFSDRTPAWWLPEKKPTRIHGVELDPQGRLRTGLLSCILFQAGPWQRDFLQPQRTLTPAGSGVVYADSPFGGTLNTTSNSYLTVALPPQTPGAWTESCLMLFNGTNPLDVCLVGTDGAGNNYFFINGPSAITPGSLTFNGNNVATGSFIASNYTGWHRITCSADGNLGQGAFYLDGHFIGSQQIMAGVNSFSSLMGDATRSNIFTNFPIADHFLWNYGLPPSQVLEHYAAPYRTVLRPKFSELGRVGPSGNMARRPSLMTTGVGP